MYDVITMKHFTKIHASASILANQTATESNIRLLSVTTDCSCAVAVKLISKRKQWHDYFSSPTDA